jgi:hypothetical protein
MVSIVGGLSSGIGTGGKPRGALISARWPAGIAAIEAPSDPDFGCELQPIARTRIAQETEKRIKEDWRSMCITSNRLPKKIMWGSQAVPRNSGCTQAA